AAQPQDLDHHLGRGPHIGHLDAGHPRAGPGARYDEEEARAQRGRGAETFHAAHPTPWGAATPSRGGREVARLVPTQLRLSLVRSRSTSDQPMVRSCSSIPERERRLRPRRSTPGASLLWRRSSTRRSRITSTLSCPAKARLISSYS